MWNNDWEYSGHFVSISNRLTSYLYCFIVCVTLSWADTLLTAYFVKSDVNACLVNVGITFSEDPIRDYVRNKPRCASECLTDGRCTKFLFCGSWANNCNRIRAFGIQKTTESETQCDCYVRNGPIRCKNGGLLVNGSCDCLYGFHGAGCELVITNCKDGYDRGGGILSDKNRDIAYICPKPNADIFPVFCLNTWGGYTYIQHRDRSFDETNFDRTWFEYVQGFGDVKGNYWLGLEQIHAITQTINKLDVGVIDGDGNYLQAYYQHFEVRDSDQEYKVDIREFSLSPHSVPGLDSLTNNSDIDGSEFVTRDHNPRLSSCPVVMHSGWWFDKSCTEANMNGPLITLEEYNNDDSQPRITWNYMGYIRYTYMRIG